MKQILVVNVKITAIYLIFNALIVLKNIVYNIKLIFAVSN
jgi:hypothetical protein